MLNYILTENKNFYQVFIIQTSQACSWIGWCERLEGKRIKEGLLMVCVLLTHQKAGIEIEDIPFCFDTSSLLLFICFVLVFFLEHKNVDHRKHMIAQFDIPTWTNPLFDYSPLSKLST